MNFEIKAFIPEPPLAFGLAPRSAVTRRLQRALRCVVADFAEFNADTPILNEILILLR
jgi:hypothetical protein